MYVVFLKIYTTIYSGAKNGKNNDFCIKYL